MSALDPEPTWKLRQNVAHAAIAYALSTARGLDLAEGPEHFAQRVITLDAFKRACERLERHAVEQAKDSP